MTRSHGRPRRAPLIAAALVTAACAAEPPAARTAPTSDAGLDASCDEPPCAPADASRDATRDAIADAAPPLSGGTPLTLSFVAEALRMEAEPGLDGRGTLLVQVFDTATPPSGAASSGAALAERTLPERAGPELDIAALPVVTLALHEPPATVFVRALFFDDGRRALAPSGGLGWGTWVGGVDLSSGFARSEALLPVELGPDGGTHTVSLTALRRVRVTVTSSAVPLGDGEGSLSVTASRDALLPPRGATFGYGIDPCVDLAAGSNTVDIGVAGSGAFFIAAFFDDLGIETPGAMPPGTMVSVRDVNLDTGEGTFDALSLAPDQYAAALSVDLGWVAPLPPGAGPPGPNSCADLGYLLDAGL